MARPTALPPNVVISTRIEKDMYQTMHDIAALETLHTGRTVSVQELIRNAIHYVYSDNERLRESFRRSRAYARVRVK